MTFRATDAIRTAVLARFPNEHTEDLASEFGCSVAWVKLLAKTAGVKKSAAYRAESYARRQIDPRCCQCKSRGNALDKWALSAIIGRP